MNFYISCPPGFEKDLVEEIQGFWFELMDLDGTPTSTALPDDDIKVEMGGVEIKTELHLGLQISFFSKIAHRILLRIHRFEARYFDQFEKGFKTGELLQWLEPQKINVEIDFQKSRLNHEKNLLEATTAALKKLGFSVDTSKIEASNVRPSLFIRIVKDSVILSLDTSGEHLHKRGYATHRGEAPLRENLAALMVRELLKHEPNDTSVGLVDPFVGSGTLLAEWLIRRTPHFERYVSGLHFKKTPKIFKSETWKKNYRWIKPILNSPPLLGFEIDTKTIQAAENNFATLKSLFPITGLNLKLVNADSKTMNTSHFEPQITYWAITNPPYGERLSDQGVIEPLLALENCDMVRGLVIVEPLHWQIPFKKFKQISSRPFSNQGLKLNLNVYTR